ncbi:hypothetical protein NPIL_696241 [Nephila pilipes]|uniref:Uncharacterized protein n=1 Tax=Nephila pilipes TaxID=299642 RepID=A0A8X6KMT1_NEPPI|nr:hypothetical protein NPIL_696241 [Nephila pilipes]
MVLDSFVLMIYSRTSSVPGEFLRELREFDRSISGGRWVYHLENGYPVGPCIRCFRMILKRGVWYLSPQRISQLSGFNSARSSSGRFHENSRDGSIWFAQFKEKLLLLKS